MLGELEAAGHALARACNVPDRAARRTDGYVRATVIRKPLPIPSCPMRARLDEAWRQLAVKRANVLLASRTAGRPRIVPETSPSQRRGSLIALLPRC